MMTKREFVHSAAMAAIAVSGSQSGRALAQANVSLPAFVKPKDVAEEGFIYGLPIVMNYGVMHQFAIDRDSGQFKAPFNQIANAHARVHLQGYRGRHAQLRYALLGPVHGPAGRAACPFGSGG